MVFSFRWSAEYCSSVSGDVFHVEDIDEEDIDGDSWTPLNIDTLRNFDIPLPKPEVVWMNYYKTTGSTDIYWTGIGPVEFKAGSPCNTDDKLCLAIEYQKDLHRYQFVDYPCNNEYVIVCEALLLNKLWTHQSFWNVLYVVHTIVSSFNNQCYCV